MTCFENDGKNDEDDHHNHIKMIDDDNISWILEDKWWDVEKKMPMMHHKPMLDDNML